MEEKEKETRKSARRKLSWLDWVLLLLAAAIMLWLVEYSLGVLMHI